MDYLLVEMFYTKNIAKLNIYQINSIKRFAFNEINIESSDESLFIIITHLDSCSSSCCIKT